jgi:FkbM family methyltransferase
MFEFQGIWFPDGEKHLPEWMAKNGELVDGKGTYQIKKWRACIPWIREWRVAVDVGAHVGLWTMQMAKRFENVIAFEPMEHIRACFLRNVTRMDRITLYPLALGAEAGKVAMHYTPESSGNTHIIAGDSVEMKPLDDYGLEHVDFVKIDCEGAELGVVRGAEETIRRCRPCMIIEQKPHRLGPNFGLTGTPAVDLVRSWGAQLRKAIGGDYIVSWDA